VGGFLKSPPRGLILASTSPQRKRLLKDLRIPFKVIAPGVDEDHTQRRPDRLVSALALRKARAVAERNPRAIVLGADTIVVSQGRIIGKPRNASDALKMIRSLNGRWHRVYTGVAILVPGRRGSLREVVVSRVKTLDLGKAGIRSYAGKHMDKAGAYAVQDAQNPFVERIIGPTDNVIGLPMDAVRRLLRLAARRPKNS